MTATMLRVLGMLPQRHNLIQEAVNISFNSQNNEGVCHFLVLFDLCQQFQLRV